MKIFLLTLMTCLVQLCWGQTVTQKAVTTDQLLFDEALKFVSSKKCNEIELAISLLRSRALVRKIYKANYSTRPSEDLIQKLETNLKARSCNVCTHFRSGSAVLSTSISTGSGGGIFVNPKFYQKSLDHVLPLSIDLPHSSQSSATYYNYLTNTPIVTGIHPYWGNQTFSIIERTRLFRGFQPTMLSPNILSPVLQMPVAPDNEQLSFIEINPMEYADNSPDTAASAMEDKTRYLEFFKSLQNEPTVKTKDLKALLKKFNESVDKSRKINMDELVE